MHKTFAVTLVFFVLISCINEAEDPHKTASTDSGLISAVDISTYPEMAKSMPVFYDAQGAPDSFLNILQKNGVNTIRLRLWVSPLHQSSSFKEVAQFSETLKNKGFKIWLSLHYSNTWADPGQQITPDIWSDLGFLELKDSVMAYTHKVVAKIKPDYIQIGNEINAGFLHPHGKITTKQQQFMQLMTSAIKAVRELQTGAKIIIHYAGLENSDWFFEQMSSLDYDIIGLSYYPIWHGKDLDHLSSVLENLSEKHQKDIFIAETAYPFTLEWNDWTNNIVGSDEQLIWPKYPATPQGQKDFIAQIKKIITQDVTRGKGFCYWGGELISLKGDQAMDGSAWENQALFNFQNHALPVLEEFSLK